jgi:hypothetical protein
VAIAWIAFGCKFPGDTSSQITDDLPNSEASVFFQFLGSMAESEQTLSIEKVVRHLHGDGESSPNLSSQLLSSSRSLQSDHVSVGMPRILLTFARPQSGQAAFARWYGQLFMGYAESVDQLEVISWNPGLGKFDFFIVDQLQQQTVSSIKRMTTEHGSTCDGCHQNQGPIFSMDPWTETNSNSDVVNAIRSALRTRGLNRDAYMGVPVEVQFGDSQVFDSATDDANRLVGLQAVWRQACPTEIAPHCRRLLIQLGVASALWPGSAATELATEYSELRRLWSKHFPAAGIRVPLSSIGDQLMDVGFELPMDPSDDRPTFDLDGNLPSQVELALRHDHLSEEMSHRNGYDSSIVFSWVRRLLFGGDIHALKQRLLNADALARAMNQPICGSLLQRPISRQTLISCATAEAP